MLRDGQKTSPSSRLKSLQRSLAVLVRTLPIVAIVAIAGCQEPFECADACSKVYSECSASVETNGVNLSSDDCLVICEEGLVGNPSSSFWVECVEDAVCPDDEASEDDKDSGRFDVLFCTPRLDLVVVAS